MDRVGIEWRREEREGMKEIREATERKIPTLRLHSFQMLNGQQYSCYLYLLHDFKWNMAARAKTDIPRKEVLMEALTS